MSGSHQQFRFIDEKHIESPTTLSLFQGSQPTKKMNPLAHGWSATPLISTELHTGLGTWGRNKRWEYWGIMTPTHIIGVTISSLEYAGVNQLYVVDRATLESHSTEVIDPLARKVTLPSTYADGPAEFVSKNLSIRIDEGDSQGSRTTRIRALGENITLDVTMTRPTTAEALHVVVPWSETRFQYTIKEPALPAHGYVKVDGERHDFGGQFDDQSFGVLDHGRGRWPYSMVWNWAAGSGYSRGSLFGLQIGDKWTDHTGSTENAVIIDGVITKISEELTWEYDRSNWLAPWRVTGSTLDAIFTPFYERVATTSLLVLSGETHQCFGTWSGTYRHTDGTIYPLDGLEGWAEEAQNKW